MIPLFPQQKFLPQFNPGKTFFKKFIYPSYITTILFPSKHSCFPQGEFSKLSFNKRSLECSDTSDMVWGPLGLHGPFQEIHEVYPFPPTYLCEDRFSPYASPKQHIPTAWIGNTDDNSAVFY